MTVKRLLCEECWEEVDATYETRHHVEDVRGVTVEVDIEHLICPKCGNSIGWAPLVDEGFDKLYRAYREKMGIMQPEDVEVLAAMFEARAEYLETFFKAVDARYGSFAAWMRVGA